MRVRDVLLAAVPRRSASVVPSGRQPGVRIRPGLDPADHADRLHDPGVPRRRERSWRRL